MNCITYLDEVARGFLEIIRSQTGSVPIPTDDYGWENHRYSSPTFRMAHVEIFNQERFMVIHCCVFPHVTDPSPIFGFDVIAGESKVTGLFMDLSPTTFAAVPPFHRLEMSTNRTMPEWGRIFSDNMIACRPTAEELVNICEMATHELSGYLSRLGRARNEGSMVAEMQDRYCLQQRRNEHTVRAIRNLLGEQRAEQFINTVLFPTVQSNTVEPYRDIRYPALMSTHDVEVLSRLARQIPDGGIAVECGSALGGSAAVILDANPRIGRLHLVDSDWADGSDTLASDMDALACELNLYHAHVIDLHLFFPIYEHRSSYDFARWYLRDRSNVVMHRTSTPYGMSDWQGMVDFVYEDSSHRNPQLEHNILFWWDRLRPGGVMAGHDFGCGVGDVDETVHRMAYKWGANLRSEGAVWWLSKE